MASTQLIFTAIPPSVSLAPSRVDSTHSSLTLTLVHAAVSHRSVSLAPSHADSTHSSLTLTPGHAAVSHPSVSLTPGHMNASHSLLPLSPDHAAVSHPSHVDTISTQVKLPKLSIRKYNGDLTKWVTFWDAFSSSEPVKHQQIQLFGLFGRILCC